MKQNYYRNRFQGMVDFLKKVRVPSKIIFISVGIISTIWFLVRVIPKPSRATYPCMRATAPWASAFIIYLLSLSGSVFSLKKVRIHVKAKHIPLATFFLIVAVGFSAISLTHTSFQARSQSEKELEAPNSPMGTARGIFPGRVVWTMDFDATNEDCTNNYGDGYFMDSNTNQDVVDEMLEDVVKRLTEENSVADAWDDIFRYHNQETGKGDVPYQAGEIIFIKINVTSAWGGNFNVADLSRVNNVNYAISETSPQLVTSVLRHLVNVVGVAESDIYIGDPMKHIYKDNYEKWHGEFPDVHYLDYSYSTLGREKVVKSTTAIIDYSDRGTVLREGDWSSALTGDPIYTDNLYTIFEDMDYMINIPTMKGHVHAGVTMFAKNHFGSQTREDAKHLHGGLVSMGNDPLRNEYGMYRVQVDLLGHELLGNKNLIYLMDALFSSEMEVNKPDKYSHAPWNNDWTSSILISQDPIAIESVGFDILYYEFDGTNGLDAYPHYGAVDDYLHQAADPANWPESIEYDPENDGSVLGSLGVHEHWNNPTDMQYTRNLGTGDGIELIRLWDEAVPYGPTITVENSELPSNQVNTLLIDSAMTVWIGTDAGLSRLTEEGWKQYDTVLFSNGVNDLAYERTQYGRELWIATDSGLTVTAYDDLDGITSATTYVAENSALVGYKVAAVAVDLDHNRWIGTDSAVSVFRGNGWDSIMTGIDAMGDQYNFSQFKINDIEIFDHENMALIATEGKGISRMSYDLVDGFTGASTYGSPWSSINSDNITAVDVADTTQWYGTDVGAYFHQSPLTKESWVLFDELYGIVDNQVNTVVIDMNRNAWIGTPAGISVVLPDGGIYNYTETDGLLNNMVNYLTSDIQGNIWAATSGGIQWFESIPGIQVVLGTPLLIAPAYGQDEVSVTPELSWTTISGATAYQLQVATDNAFENLVVDEDNVSTTSITLPELEDDMMFYWRVAATNGTLTSSWSFAYNFITEYIEGVIDFGTDDAITIYPVPFDNYLIIESASIDVSGGIASIYSLDGRLRKQIALVEERARINTGDLPKGAYILQISDGSVQYNCKIVK